MAPERIKKSTSAAGQHTLQELPVPQQRTAKKKRKSEEETITISSGDEASTQLVPQRKKVKAKAKEPVPLSSNSAESDSDLDETFIGSDEDGDDDYDDDRSAEELEEIERTQLLHTLEGQDSITIDQAIVLEPCETFTHEGNNTLELDLQDSKGKSLRISSGLYFAYLFYRTSRARKII